MIPVNAVPSFARLIFRLVVVLSTCLNQDTSQLEALLEEILKDQHTLSESLDMLLSESPLSCDLIDQSTLKTFIKIIEDRLRKIELTSKEFYQITHDQELLPFLNHPEKIKQVFSILKNIFLQLKKNIFQTA